MVAVNGLCCCSSPSVASSVQHQPLWLRNDRIHIVFFMSGALFSFGFGLIDFLSTQLLLCVHDHAPTMRVFRSPCSLLKYHTTIAQLWPKSKRCDSDGVKVTSIWSVIQGCAIIFLYRGKKKNDNLLLTWRKMKVGELMTCFWKCSAEAVVVEGWNMLHHQLSLSKGGDCIWKIGVLELLRHNPSSRTTSNCCLSACVRICASDNILFISLEMESCHLLLSFAHLLGDRKCDGLKVPKKQTNCKVVPQGQDGSVCTLYHTGVASILRISVTKCSNPIFIDWISQFWAWVREQK